MLKNVWSLRSLGPLLGYYAVLDKILIFYGAVTYSQKLFELVFAPVTKQYYF